MIKHALAVVWIFKVKGGRGKKIVFLVTGVNRGSEDLIACKRINTFLYGVVFVPSSESKMSLLLTLTFPITILSFR